ncbi:helix-turn-helix domain-containing protein [Sagittula sp. NFXS13]
MGLLNIIRRMALRQKLPIREIARRTGVSRNTIKKYLNAGTIEPRFATPERQSKLDPFSGKRSAAIRSARSERLLPAQVTYAAPAHHVPSQALRVARKFTRIYLGHRSANLPCR